MNTTANSEATRTCAYLLATSLAALAIGAAVSIDAGRMQGLTGVAFGVSVCVLLVGYVDAFARTLSSLIGGSSPLPRVHSMGKIPSDCRVAVVIPALLSSQHAIKNLADRLAQHFCSTLDPNVTYVALTDYVDADERVLLEDEALLDAAVEMVASLNELHAEKGAQFILLHRSRKYAPRQLAWMGTERKRGKLMDLNSLILTGDSSAFDVTEGGVDALRSIKYVLCVDSDTTIPKGTVLELVRCLAHPDNRPVFAASSSKLVRGHAYIQPTMETYQPVEGERTVWQTLMGGVRPPARSIITRESSDQCLFGVSPFFGKGMYDVSAVDRALRGRLPEDCVLSHDVLEGALGRCASMSSVSLLESIPADPLAESTRRHRWIRGDWQNLFIIAHDAIGHWRRQQRPPTYGWTAWLRVLTNARRALTSIAFCTLVCCLAPHPMPGLLPVAWLLIMFAWVPIALNDSFWLAHKVDIVSWRSQLRYGAKVFAHRLLCSAIGISLAPFDAVVSARAMWVAGWRCFVTRTRLLDWTASDVDKARQPSSWLAHALCLMAGPLSGAAVIANSRTWPPAAAGLLWTASPLTVLWLRHKPSGNSIRTDSSRRHIWLRSDK